MLKWNHNNLMKVTIQGKEKYLSYRLFFRASENILSNSDLFEFVIEFKKNKFALPQRTEGKE